MRQFALLALLALAACGAGGAPEAPPKTAPAPSLTISGSATIGMARDGGT